MAKPQKKQDALRSLKPIPSKSLPAKLPAAKAPAARVAAGKLPPSKGRVVKLPATRTAATKLPVSKSAAAKTAAAKAPARKSEPPKPFAVKAAAGKPQAVRLKKASPVAEQSPATEAQIVEALAGKLSSRATGTGFSWLGTAATPKPAAPETVVAEIQTEAPEAATETTPPAAVVMETLNVAEEILVEMVPVTEPAETVPTDEPAQEEVIAEAPAIVEEPVKEETKVEEPAITELKADEPQTAAVDVTPDPKEWVPQAAANEQSLGKTLKFARDRIGWALTVQAGLFVAFCVLKAKNGTPHGFHQILLGGIPLFAMVMICTGLASCHATQVMLDKLEAERLRFQRLQQGLPATGTATPTDSFTNARWLAYWPSMIILGILLVVWLCIGLTVWFL